VASSTSSRGKPFVDEELRDLLLVHLAVAVDARDGLPAAGRAWAVDLVDDEDRRRPSSSALRSTKRVCGMTPSTASTSSSTPSTMFSTRSTSPPKSAWPGVSTMLILTPPVADRGVLRQDGDPALALQVVGVHHALRHLPLGGSAPVWRSMAIDQRRLAVVDVRDDRDVADVLLRPGSGPANRRVCGS
jgi:hypothetical protein